MFSEIFLITLLENDEYYVPLKAYLLLNEAYCVYKHIKDNKLVGKLEHMQMDFWDVFAEVLFRKGHENIYIGFYNDKKILFHNLYGIGIEENGSNEFGFAIYDLYPLYSKNHYHKYVFENRKDFFNERKFSEYLEECKDSILSTGFVFHTLKVNKDLW